MQPRRRVVAILLPVVALAALLILVFDLERRTLLPPAMGLTGDLLALQGFYSLYLPLRARRIFEQQKSLHAPFTVEATSEGLNWSSSPGDARMPWSYFPRWKENAHLFLIYQSDAVLLMVPTRAFRSRGELDGFREALEWHIPPG